MATTFRLLGKPLLIGLAASILLVLIMVFVTINFQVILPLGVLLFYLSGRINKSVPLSIVMKLLLIMWSFIVLFALFVLTEIPALFYIPLFCLLSCWLAIWAPKLNFRSGIVLTFFAVMVVFFMLYVIPISLKDSLSEALYKPMPVAELTDLNNRIISTGDFKGKTVVLDFFGTWCKPCIQELKELNHVQQYFKDDPSVAFFVINADLGGDTPEKFERFIAAQSYGFSYLYDHESSFFKQLQLNTSGLPYLLVVDKNGMLRWQHVGFNSAETNFAENLITTIRQIQDEE